VRFAFGRGARKAFWDDATGTLVIRNPSAVDGGTALRPAAGKKDFNNLK
jgi:filamentous hemagglutinin